MLRKPVQIDRRISVLVVVAIIGVVLLARFLPQQLRVMSNQRAAESFGLPSSALDYLYTYLGSGTDLRYADKVTNVQPLLSLSPSADDADEIWCVIVDFDDPNWQGVSGRVYLQLFQKNQQWVDASQTRDLTAYRQAWEAAGCEDI